jgi:hypothetical protein
MTKPPAATVLSLAQLLERQAPTPPPCLVEPGLLPVQGILFVGGEPKVGKSLLVANLALSLAAGSDRLGFPVPAPRRVLVCQFELPIPQFVSRLATMRRVLGSAADQNLFIDTRATGHLLSARRGCNTSSPPRRRPPRRLLSWTHCIPRTIRMKTTPAPWPRCARACCACARLPEPR